MFNEPSAPTILWSHDMTTVTCNGSKLSLARLRDGIDQIFVKVTKMIDSVTVGCTFDVPADLVEDFNEDGMGYSWMHPTKFTREPFHVLKGLLEGPKPLATLAANGDVTWIIQRVKRYQDFFDSINQYLAVLSFLLPGPSSRGTEFVNDRISNSQLRRNVYKHYGTWFIRQRTKTTNLSGKLSWTPTLCPDKLTHLLDKYLILIRPVECIFADVIAKFDKTPDGRAVYDEFLWVQGGQQMTSPQFSTLLGQVTDEFMGTHLTLRPWRHISVALMREFIHPHYDRDYLGDLLSNHSTAQAQKTYARELTQLPFLTTDLLYKSQEICEAWHDVLGVGKHDPPLPMRLLTKTSFARSLSLGSDGTPSPGATPSPGGSAAQSRAATPAGPSIQAQFDSLGDSLKAYMQTQIQALELNVQRNTEKAVATGMAVYMQTSGVTEMFAEVRKISSMLTTFTSTPTPSSAFPIIPPLPPLPSTSHLPPVNIPVINPAPTVPSLPQVPQPLQKIPTPPAKPIEYSLPPPPSPPPSFQWSESSTKLAEQNAQVQKYQEEHGTPTPKGPIAGGPTPPPLASSWTAEAFPVLPQASLWKCSGTIPSNFEPPTHWYNWNVDFPRYPPWEKPSLPHLSALLPPLSSPSPVSKHGSNSTPPDLKTQNQQQDVVMLVEDVVSSSPGM